MKTEKTVCKGARNWSTGVTITPDPCELVAAAMLPLPPGNADSPPPPEVAWRYSLA